MTFPCIQCGLCCRQAWKVPGAPLNDDGSCQFLDGTRCTIYHYRPAVCRVGPDEWTVSAQACNQLLQEAGDPRRIEVTLAKPTRTEEARAPEGLQERQDTAA